MSAPRELTTVQADVIYAAINSAGSPDQFDQIVRDLWRHYVGGTITDSDATFLQSCIDRKRPPSRNGSSRATALVAANRLVGRVGGRFTPRQRPRSPDRRASRDRRRRLGGSSALPDTLRHYYTEDQRAVLCIVSGEVKHHGACDLPIDKIAALAGVCRTTVQTTLHEARRLGHLKVTERPVPGRKNLPNLVEIKSPEWHAWVKRRPFAPRATGSNSLEMVSTTKNTD